MNFKTLEKYSELAGKSKVADLAGEEIELLLQYSNLFNSLFINADGIYLTTYSCLLLNLKLIYLGYYDSNQKEDIPLSEVSGDPGRFWKILSVSFVSRRKNSSTTFSTITLQSTYLHIFWPKSIKMFLWKVFSKISIRKRRISIGYR